eukprot:ANDGO_02396.mRNA.1 Glutamate-rich WD repeat-containing protein 1
MPMDGAKRRKGVQFSESQSNAEQNEEMNIQFEDDFGDDYDEDEGEVVVDAGEGDNEDDEDTQMKELADGDHVSKVPGRVWRKGVDTMEEGETLDYDPTAYNMFHQLRTEWPSLSFDIIRDKFGMARKRYPHTMYFAAGTQAESVDENKISLYKCAKLSRTRFDDDPDNSDRDEDDDSDIDEDPEVECRTINHRGCVNRIRSMPQTPNILATWSELGSVSLFDVSQHLAALDSIAASKISGDVTPFFVCDSILQSSSGKQRRGTEGYAMDWSTLDAQKGYLAIGNCKGHVGVCVPTSSTGSAWTRASFVAENDGHSIEDIQWSPTEQYVFCGACVDGSVRVFDMRQSTGKASVVVGHAHASDVNVISWNKTMAYLLASGGDDGVFRVWDLRMFNSGTFAASFDYHKAPITSIEWHPTDSSVLAVSSDDDQITLWDLSVERDDSASKTAQTPEAVEEEERVQGMRIVGSDHDEDVKDVPPQLMFVHQGQQQVKEVHWHPQIPGSIVSTASEGFNIFVACNM